MIRKDLLKTIIVDNQLRKYPTAWERNLQVPLNTSKIITLSGVRRSGKTYHLYNLIRTLLSQGIKKEQILYLNFEDERLDMQVSDLDHILTSYQELYPELDLSQSYFFFDEIQEVEGWEKFIARIHSSITQNVFITGSNAKLLSREIATALRGRALNFEVYPLTFQEYLRITSPKLNPHSTKDQPKYLKAFNKFMEQGGFPELITQPQDLHTHTLQSYFDVMLMRDLIERYEISQTPILRYFCKRLIGNSAGELSINKVYHELKFQGYKISKDTIYAYGQYVEAIYLIRQVSKHSHSTVKRELSLKKIYAIDTALASIIDYKFATDMGRKLENLVALELIKAGNAVMYQKNGTECDFILQSKGKITTAIQVSHQLATQDTKDREVKGLLSACRYHKLKEGYILTLNESHQEIINNIKIITIPTWKYLLINNQ